MRLQHEEERWEVDHDNLSHNEQSPRSSYDERNDSHHSNIASNTYQQHAQYGVSGAYTCTVAGSGCSEPSKKFGEETPIMTRGVYPAVATATHHAWPQRPYKLPNLRSSAVRDSVCRLTRCNCIGSRGSQSNGCMAMDVRSLALHV